MKTVDLRSDTVTQPTGEMRTAMAQAAVGDDVYGEDPSVNRLQQLSAEMLGKEAGLFIPSGTMGNLSAVLAHCGRGDEVILGHLSHTFLYECGGISTLGGIHSHQVRNQPDGTMDLDEIEQAIRIEDSHFPITRLILLENTHNRCGGVSIGVEYLNRVAHLAKRYDLKMHLDGARIFNAAADLGASAAELAAPFDSVTFCLSKGLCAPVGSVLCGSKEFIYQAHRVRKQLGGGMRQAGILAAAGIIALERMVDRLEEDHLRAGKLADGLREIPGILVDPGSPNTNMVYINLDRGIVPGDASQTAASLDRLGVKVGVTSQNRMRLVTHYWIDDGSVDFALDAFQKVLV